MVLLQLESKRACRGLWKATLLVQQGEYAERLLFNEIKTLLIIVEIDVRPVELLLDILLLL